MKTFLLTCNDPGKSNVVLEITGTIWKPIKVTPAMAVFKVSDDMQTNQTMVVHIVNHLDKPLTLSDLQCTNHTFKAELKAVKPGTEFEVRVTAVPPFTSPAINGLVSLKTSAPTMPTIKHQSPHYGGADPDGYTDSNRAAGWTASVVSTKSF